MNNNCKTNNKRAFSLAEVLVTMFIVVVVTVLSAPLITKKIIKNPPPRGVWDCVVDKDGRLVSTMSIDGQSGGHSISVDHCTFSPPAGASNFSVTVVGGGGGGASSTISFPDAISYSGAVSFVVPSSAQYDVLVIGGGGGSTAKLVNSNVTSGNGGAGGMVIRKKLSLTQNDRYVLEAGAGGGGGSCIRTSYRDECYGQNGNESKFYRFGSGDITTAGGGEAAKRAVAGKSGGPNVFAGQNGNSSRGGFIFGSGGYSEAINIVGTRMAQYAAFGHGGFTSNSTGSGGPGHNGVVMVVSNTFYSGGGGESGQVVYRTIDKINSSVDVYIGQGGEGAVTESVDGKQGENTSFGSYAVAGGGAGGVIKAFASSSVNSVLSGQDGAPSPYGAVLSGGSSSQLNGTNNMDILEGYVDNSSTLSGAGGGGGAAKARSNCSPNNGYAGCWGKGGRGSSGYVRVEWN